MEQSLQVSPLFHLRMITLMANLLIADTLFVAYSVKYTMENGANMLIVFGFEYAILVAVLLATFFKYVVHMIDSRTEEAWENKSMYIFYLELVTGIPRPFLVIYIRFYEVDDLPHLLCGGGQVLQRASPHHPRHLRHPALFPAEVPRSGPLPSGHSQHERAVSRCHHGRAVADVGSHLYHLPRGDGSQG